VKLPNHDLARLGLREEGAFFVDEGRESALLAHGVDQPGDEPGQLEATSAGPDARRQEWLKSSSGDWPKER